MNGFNENDFILKKNDITSDFCHRNGVEKKMKKTRHTEREFQNKRRNDFMKEKHIA